MNSEFERLKNVNLDNYIEPIKPLRRGNLASEYNDYIYDYSKSEFAITGRKIYPYSTKSTHGVEVFDGIRDYIRENGFRKILDLGCAAGELLQEAKIAGAIELHGCNIHVGEVAECRKIGLDNVIPLDMRDILKVYERNYFNLVIAHQMMQFIPEEDRIKLAIDVYEILRPNGVYMVIDYYGNVDSKLDLNHKYPYKEIRPLSIQAKGNVTVLIK